MLEGGGGEGREREREREERERKRHFFIESQFCLARFDHVEHERFGKVNSGVCVVVVVAQNLRKNCHMTY